MKRFRLYLYIYMSALMLMWVQGTASAQSRDWVKMQKGNRAFNQKKYETAAGHYDKALEANPANARAMFNKANVDLAQNHLEEALKGYDTALQSEKNNLMRSMAHHNKGFIHQTIAGAEKDPQKRTEQLKAAIEDYKAALRENPGSDASRYNLALCQKQLKNQKDRNNQDNEQNKQKQPQPQPQPQTDNKPLMNYARQAEQQTRQKMQEHVRSRSLEKNW
ncbi:MAG: tetratricopeptide repeat protein [Alloprevotella sp.]